MRGIIQLQIGQFLLIYLLLLVVLGVMRLCRIDQTRLLVVSSMKMTVQLIVAGLILTYIFEHPHPLFVVAYLGAMTGFSIHRVLAKNKGLNPPVPPGHRGVHRPGWPVCAGLLCGGGGGGEPL